jgi:L,D-peptidoglycan transpeptidase YkuD (ErfK/YbiS/YcfS/YnhG family)
MQAMLHSDGRFVLLGHVFRAALGRTGVRREKREGDGATPAGPLPLRRVLYRADRVGALRCAVPTEPIAPHDGWCDDVNHADYNRMIQGPHEGHYEQLWRQDAIYDVIGVLGWNDAPVRRGCGSAIFLHLAHPDFRPTAGCIALALADLQQVLAAGLTEVVALPG